MSPRIAARLVALDVREGEEVVAGDVLATLDCAEPEAALLEAQARLAAAQAQAAAAAAQARAAGAQTSATSLSSQAARAQAEALAAQRDAAARQADRVVQLDDGSSVATRDASTTSADALLHQALAAQAQAKASRIQVELATGQAEAASATATAAAEQVRAAEATVARAALHVGECTVRAPRGGVVETLPFAVGELVPQGGTVATVVDIREVTATFYIANGELAAAAVGDAATVVADAWPGETFTGRVTHVGTEAAFTPRNIQTRSDRDRLVYPVEVVLENPAGKLRPGMPVDVRLGTR